MFSRRSFFKALGSTILGTAIALKLPDSIVHIPIIPMPDGSANVLTWSMLNEMYNRCLQGRAEPSYIYLGRPISDDINWI